MAELLICDSYRPMVSQSYGERAHKGYACVERSKTEGIKQRAGRRHKGHAAVHSPEPPHTKPTPPTRTGHQWLMAEIQSCSCSCQIVFPKKTM
eukprot:366212-Chlamydomonas_euryale.AAC.19